MASEDSNGGASEQGLWAIIRAWSVGELLIRGGIGLISVALLVIGGLYALNLIKDNVDYFQSVSDCEGGDLQACYDRARFPLSGQRGRRERLEMSASAREKLCRWPPGIVQARRL